MKIINWYKFGWNNMNPVGKWIVLMLLILISIGIIYPEHGIYWAVGGFIGVVTLLIWNTHMEISIQKRNREFLEKKNADDPDWETYKKLKSKFKGV